ncbi:MAG: LysM peptidoglycan-binding domain-containing protein [Spirochaetales bacterium]|nr:LysM peptidoglycan-binding domain-containing protein [Spirochaetales bacterium]
MNEPTIGIKIANGTYYPILEEGSLGKKKLVLTTVKDNQESVQIDLYKGAGEEITDATYIGSLVIENIEGAGSGEPEIQLIIGLDDDGNLEAIASDDFTGESQSLHVSLESLAEESVYDIPDFELDSAFAPGISPEEANQLTQMAVQVPEPEKPRKRNLLRIAGFVLLGLLLVVLSAILLYRLFQGPETPKLQAEGDAPVAVAAEETPESSAEETETAEETTTETTVAEETSSPGEEVLGGVWYRIRWGDTLWDISASYYRTPWLYGSIAKENNIKNPDLIYAGNDLFIPEK